MHTKNYKQFAAMFRAQMSKHRKLNNFAGINATRNIIRASADIFTEDNSRFNRDIFLNACDYAAPNEDAILDEAAKNYKRDNGMVE